MLFFAPLDCPNASVGIQASPRIIKKENLRIMREEFTLLRGNSTVTRSGAPVETRLSLVSVGRGAPRETSRHEQFAANDPRPHRQYFVNRPPQHRPRHWCSNPPKA